MKKRILIFSIVILTSLLLALGGIVGFYVYDRKNGNDWFGQANAAETPPSNIAGTSKPANVNATFGLNDWDTIADVSKYISTNNLTTAEVEATFGWKIGDKKEITISETDVNVADDGYLMIIGFNHDYLSSDHKTKAGITLQLAGGMPTTTDGGKAYNGYKFANDGQFKGDWSTVEMRTTTLPTIKAGLPADLQKLIKPVDKKYITTENIIGTVSDELFLLATPEVFSETCYPGDDSTVPILSAFEGTQYEYYKNFIGDRRFSAEYEDSIGLFLWKAYHSYENQVKTEHPGGRDDGCSWWLRTMAEIESSTKAFFVGSMYSVPDSELNPIGSNISISFALCI